MWLTIQPSLIPKGYTLEHLRELDFTGCVQITDKAIARLVKLAPRTRSLTLAKCTRLTDEAAEHIAKLGRHLHHLHLGHVDK
jgi:F-box and leucine-rich repeat protein GRR1